MNIRTFKKLKTGDKIHYDAMGVGYHPYTVTKVENKKVYTKDKFNNEMIIEEGEQSFFSLIK
jgi:hypothetical protein